MTRFDVESLLSGVKAILVAGLNTKIAAIEAEKIAVGAPATGVTAVDTVNGYFEQNWSDSILNISPAIFYGVEEIRAQGVGPATAEVIKLFVEIIIVDQGQDTLASKRLMRYTRAIQETLQDAFADKLLNGQIKIETVRPVSFKFDSNTSEEMRVAGVSITTALA